MDEKTDTFEAPGLCPAVITGITPSVASIDGPGDAHSACLRTLVRFGAGELRIYGLMEG